MIDAKLLEILACPACKSPLEYDPQCQELICQDQDRATRKFRPNEPCGLIYSIQEGIPVLMIEAARSPHHPPAPRSNEIRGADETD